MYPTNKVVKEYVDDSFTFCSVDEMVRYYTATGWNKPYEYIISQRSRSLLLTLKSDTNKPSDHDLQLLYVLSGVTNSILDYSILPTTYDGILEIYKNRKV